ncbi:hypothetical protein A2U01_0086677, partial [Trifolium medium]|nr:hypothetical protein [Trifolium medium]
NLAFAEEEAVIHRIKVLEDELEILHKKREEFHLSNKDEISRLLAKRRSMACLEVKTKNLGDDLRRINEDLATSKKCKRALEDLQ